MEVSPSPCSCRLVGRGHEQQLLDQLAQHVVEGRSRSLVLVGEPGIGKTALLKHLDEQARPATRVLRVAGVQSEEELPYAGLHQLVGTSLEVADALPPPQRTALRIALGVESGDPPGPFLVALAVHGLLVQLARDRPVLCVVDDHQWLDSASGRALTFVARRIRDDRVGIVLAARTSTADLETLPLLQVDGIAAHEAERLLDETLRSPLDADVRRLLLQESAGNPLALLELSRETGPADLAGGYALPAALPLDERIETTFRARLVRLPADTQRLLLLAAAEPTGQLDLLWRAAEAEGLSTEAASPALQEGLLRVESRVRFQHPLVRSAVYRGAGLPDRRSAHATLAFVTDAVSDPDRRAWHLAAAAVGPDDELAAELDRCAQRALARGGLSAAAAFRRRAAGLTLDPAARVHRLLVAAEVARDAGDLDGALELVSSVGPGNGPVENARRLRLRGQISMGRERSEEAFEDMQAAAQLFEGNDSTQARLTYLEGLHAAIWMSSAGDFTNAKKVAAAIPPTIAQPGGARGTSTLVTHMLAGFRAQTLVGYTGAAVPFRRALDLLLGDPEAAAPTSVLFQAALSIPLTLWDESAWLRLAERAVDASRRMGALHMLPSALSSLAVLRVWEGDLATASELIEESRDVLFVTGSSFRTETDLILAAWRGSREVALALAAQVREAFDAGQAVPVQWCGYAESVLLNGLSRFDEALDAALPLLCEDHVAASTLAATELADAASRSGAVETLRELRGWVHARTSTAPTAWSLGVLARIDGLLGGASDADHHYGASLTHLAACSSRSELARTHLAYGEWLRRRGRRTDARRQLRPALDLFEDVGAMAFADRTARELRAAGDDVGAVVPAQRGELTAQESQVASLASQGLTNPEIAARLFISPRTVQYHLRKVYLKLNITSRAQL